LKNTRTILVVGNYPADQQQSMIRVAQLLVWSYKHKGHRVRLVQPPVCVTRLPGLPAVARKYLAYVDKLLLFPLWLLLRARSFDLVHIADHSNAFYSFCVKPRRCIVICHDLLAIRGAMGDASAACKASAFGLWLQRLIMAGLRRPAGVSFISQATYDDFQRLIGRPRGQRHAVIHLPLNAPFKPDPDPSALPRAERALLPPRPFLLMVGSALPRKNRALSLRVLELLGESSPYRLVFAGEALTPDERSFTRTHPLGDRVLSIVGPSHAFLNVLYGQAHALLFPSFSEGFGWPLIEAQASGCPVIASTTTSIPEVAGIGALYGEPQDADAFASHVKDLEQPGLRAQMIERGFANIRRFMPEAFADVITQFALQP
jgi:glycosyltransferase involved in cell wall biosynthesis